MAAHGHGLGAVGVVIAIHVAAMFLPSPLTGYLVDRFGRLAISLAAGITLLLSGVVAAVVPGHSTVWLAVALALLGLGWNFGLVAGSAIIIDSTTPTTRPRMQGAVDVFVALGGATGGALSGVVMGGAGFEVLALSGGILSLLLVPVLVVDRLRRRPEGAAA
ncbi:MAG: MFS transporter, partial [Rhodococcus sp.]|nr:MFS transporter [Rhodococcus sp. (in: high G+C Gram-positive bacteria)]